MTYSHPIREVGALEVLRPNLEITIFASVQFSITCQTYKLDAASCTKARKEEEAGQAKSKDAIKCPKVLDLCCFVGAEASEAWRNGPWKPPNAGHGSHLVQLAF